MQALIPRLTGRAISDAVVDRSPEKFGRTLATLALVSGVTAVASGLRGSCFLVAMAHLGLRVRHRLYRAMLQQDMAFFDDSRTGPPRPAPPAPPAPRAPCRRGDAGCLVGEGPWAREEAGGGTGGMGRGGTLEAGRGAGDLMSRLASDTQTMTDAIGLNVNVVLRSLVQAPPPDPCHSPYSHKPVTGRHTPGTSTRRGPPVRQRLILAGSRAAGRDVGRRWCEPGRR